jgi:hypothetical protein
MILFNLEDYFYNITPIKRWGFLIIFIFVFSIWQYFRVTNNYFEQKVLKQKLNSQLELLNHLKNNLAQKKTVQDYCDFYKLDYAELKVLLEQIVNSHKYIKNIVIETCNNKILVHLDLDN